MSNYSFLGTASSTSTNASVSSWLQTGSNQVASSQGVSFRWHSIGFQTTHIKSCSDWVSYFSNFSEIWSFFLFFYFLALTFFFYYIIPESYYRFNLSVNSSTPVSWVSGAIACGVPFVLIFSILYESVYMLFSNEVAPSKNSPLFLIEGKQWKWEYRYSLMSVLETSAYSKKLGTSVEASSYRLTPLEAKKISYSLTNFFGSDLMESSLRVKSELLKSGSSDCSKLDLLKAGSIRLSANPSLIKPSLAGASSFFTGHSISGSMRRMVTATKSVVAPDFSFIRAHITSTDVIHSWTIPGLGVRIDAVPGKLYVLKIPFKHHGVFTGQCSEVCGLRHAYMPISFSFVPSDFFFKTVSVAFSSTYNHALKLYWLNASE